MSFEHRPLNGTDRLPAEIVAQILDNAKDAITRPFHACCFVCVGWHFYLIESLYETICLRSRSQLYRLASAVRIYPTVRRRIASARALVLWPHRRSAFVDVFPLVLGPHLHKLEHLSFRGCDMHPPHVSFFGMLPLFKGVKFLELSTCSPRSFADLHRIFCAFPQLEELYIADSTRSSMNPSQPAPPHLLNLPCALKLRSVRINRLPSYFLCNLVAWLSLSGVCNTAQRLDISLDSIYGIKKDASVDALLAHAASTLEHLRMRILIESTHSLLHAHSRCQIACRSIG